MRPLAVVVLLLSVAGCATQQSRLFWSVREMALAYAPAIELQTPGGKSVLTIKAQTVNKLLLAHLRITRSAGVQAELVIVEEERPNAFVGLVSGRRVIAINTGMIQMIGDDIDEFAALLCHETAHWAKGHVDAGTLRSKTIEGMGALIGSGLGMAGIPAVGLITGIGGELIAASFSRDDEREADATSVDYMISNGFDPKAALRLQEKIQALPGGLSLPFLNSHPSGAERVDHFKRLIEAKMSQPLAIPERPEDR